MKYFITFSLLILSLSFTYAQKDIFYVWIDAQITQDGKEVQLVSEEPIKITCCVKSPKFRRFQNKAVKWIRKNYDSAFDGEHPLQNIEDKSLALARIEDAKKEKDSGQNIIMVNYNASCK